MSTVTSKAGYHLLLVLMSQYWQGLDLDAGEAAGPACSTGSKTDSTGHLHMWSSMQANSSYTSESICSGRERKYRD